MGERIEVWSQGVLIEVTDTRTIEEERAKKIAEIKEKTKEDILAVAPMHTQSNIALGIISEEESNFAVDLIIEHRRKCRDIIDRIIACKTLDELDNLK